jgi:hypothetical protein
MRTLTLIILILAARVLPATARLGWTLEQCEKQYGSPDESDLGQAAHQGYEFHVGDFVLICEFEGGFCGAIKYSKKDGRGFSTIEAADLVKKNSPGVQWTKPVIRYYECRAGDEKYNEYYAEMYSIQTPDHPEAYFVYIYSGKNAQDCLWFRISFKRAEDVTPGL